MSYHICPNVAERHGLDRIAVRLVGSNADAVCDIVADGFHISGIWINDHRNGPRVSWPVRDTPKGSMLLDKTSWVQFDGNSQRVCYYDSGYRPIFIKCAYWKTE